MGPQIRWRRNGWKSNSQQQLAKLFESYCLQQKKAQGLPGLFRGGW